MWIRTLALGALLGLAAPAAAQTITQIIDAAGDGMGNPLTGARGLTLDRWGNVFVAGLVGAGALMSVLIGLTESISSARGRERLKRQAAPTAAMMAQGTVHGYEHVLDRDTGLRPRSH